MVNLCIEIQYLQSGLEVKVVNATFNKISVLLVEETEYPEKPPACR